MGSQNEDADRTQVPLKYAHPSDISDEVLLAAAQAAGPNGNGGYVREYEMAWALSDHERPATGLRAAPDVSAYAVEQAARRLALRKGIIAQGDRMYLVPPAEDKPASS